MASTATTFDTDCELMLHMDGADGSTTFTDSSTNGFTVTANGNAQIDTAASKFGGASGLFDGTGDYLSVADNAVFDIGTGDFTIDFWLNQANTSAFHEYFGSTAGTGDYLDFYYDKGGGGQYIIRLQNSLISGPFAIVAGTWYHFAMTRSGTSVKVFKDGVTQGTHTVSSTITLGGSFEIGNNQDAVGDLNGALDEWRLVVGTAVWTGDFTPPSAAYTSASGSTKILKLMLLGVG